MDAFVIRRPVTDDDGDHDLSPSVREEADERPSKRIKRDEIQDSQSDDPDESAAEESRELRPIDPDDADDALEDPTSRVGRLTDVENVLPPTQMDEGAVAEYEALRSSQIKGSDDDKTEDTSSKWAKGRSSIYVDAFNLALDTVLEEEAHLFNDKEMDIFRQWRDLNYEAQYLYVRLFLRKTASWHRSSRLGYYSDVSDPEAAIETLQELRSLPTKGASEDDDPIPGVDLEIFSFGDTFTFAEKSEEHITSVEEAASLLYLDELKSLAKEAKVQGRNKAELVKNLSRMSQQQAGLMTLGLSRQNSRDSAGSGPASCQLPGKAQFRREDSNRESHFLNKILSILGPCVRLSLHTFKLFERVHLVFYRSTEWTEKSLTAIILAKMAKWSFPTYIVCRTSNIFASRAHLLEHEAAIRLEAEVDNILEFNGPPGEAGFQKILDVFGRIYGRWQVLVAEEKTKEKTIYEMGEGAYLRRFTPAHSYTRIIHKALYVMGRRKEHFKEHALLSELLEQRLFHMARRGPWYQRKALLEEHYMASLDPEPVSQDLEQQKKHWKRIAVKTCEAGLQDPDCHLIYHYDLQKRLTKLEKQLRIPRRLQHDFGHVRLEEPLEITVEGVQLKRDLPVKPGRQAALTRTIWLDELDSGEECSVEEMCLSHFRSKGWKGYHSEGGIVRTLFAYLFYDILFLYIPNVFQTEYQTCPLDLHTDAFFPVRASEINHRLVEIANGEAERLVREVWDRESEKRTSIVGLKWDYDVEDLAELVRCFEGSALAALCKVMAQEYRQRGGGVPDLILWRPSEHTPESEKHTHPGSAQGEVMFAEVKSANDRLSDTQRLWLHVLTGAGVKVALCHALAKEVREVD